MSLKKPLTEVPLVATVGDRIKSIRKQRKWSQEVLADNLGIKTETLRHIEKGRRAPRINYLTAIAEELGIDLNTLIIANLEAVEDIDAIPWQVEQVVEAMYLAMSEALRMDRRSAFVGLSSTVATGPDLLNSLDHWLQPYHPPTQTSVKDLPMGKLGMDEVKQIELTAKELFEWQHRYGGGPCRQVAIALLHEVAGALQAKQSSQVTKALHNIMADLGQTVATMTWHCGMERLAQDYYKLALRAAYVNQDPLFGACILMRLARQMMYLNKPHDALKLIQLARHGTKHIAGPQVKTMIYIRESYIMAVLGHEAEFQRATALAYEYMEQAKPGYEPVWVEMLCAKDELARITAASFAKLAKKKPKKYALKAEDERRKALQVCGKHNDRVTALSYIGIAESRFLLKEVESAVKYTYQALNSCKHFHANCLQVHKRLQDLYAYTKKYKHIKSVHQLSERLEKLFRKEFA